MKTHVPQTFRPFVVRRPGVALALLLGLVAFAAPRRAASAALPRDEWSRSQSLDVPAPGLLRIALPPSTLGGARSGLEDLRVIGPRGDEVPYATFADPFADPAGTRRAAPRRFLARLEAGATVLTIETGVTNEIEAVTLQTAARDFIKAARVEGSRDQRTWTPLAEGIPLFRQAGATRLTAEFAPGPWPWLRVILDDVLSAPVGFTDAAVHFKSPPWPWTHWPAVVQDRAETNRRTRLTLRLPAAHLRIAAIVLDTPEPMFLRAVSAWGRQVTDRGTNLLALGQGEIHRLAVETLPRSTNLVVPIERAVPTDELIVEIANEDSPPLALASVGVRVRPTYLVFQAEQAGAHEIWTGNPRCTAPRYDLGRFLGAGLDSLPASSLVLGPPRTNDAFRAPTPLPDVQERAARFDVRGWTHRKPITVAASGIQQLELDPELLSRARSDLADLRLLRGDEPVPYVVVEGNPGLATLVPGVENVPDPKQPRRSRWKLTLPHPALPISRLGCSSSTALFQRSMTLVEVTRDERGFEHRQHLGSAEWEARPGTPAATLGLVLNGRPSTDTLWLETDDGDNPPIQLSGFEVRCRLPRLRFKLTGDTAQLSIVYGNPEASAPQYDLRLVRDELLSATAHPATLGAAIRLSEDPWAERLASMGSSGPVFWAVLVLVAGTLLWVIVRFLPKTDSSSPP